MHDGVAAVSMSVDFYSSFRLFYGRHNTAIIFGEVDHFFGFCESALITLDLRFHFIRETVVAKYLQVQDGQGIRVKAKLVSLAVANTVFANAALTLFAVFHRFWTFT